MHGPVGRQPARHRQKLAHQIANYSCFTWLNGSFIVDWLIHNIDVCCWVKNAWPVSVQGMGGRQVRTDADQLFDHYFAEYTFPDGTRMLPPRDATSTNCYDFFGDVIQGTTGSAVLGEGQPKPRLFKATTAAPPTCSGRYRGPATTPTRHEHDLLFDAIRNDKPCNETERCA
jgi:myo-inositol 2-dehydrogenase / D-chiro-inositol 1-dehydrogenase